MKESIAMEAPKRPYIKKTPEERQKLKEEKERIAALNRPKGRPATGRKEKYDRVIKWETKKDSDRPEVKAIRIRFDQVFQYLLDNHETPGVLGIKSEYSFCKENAIRPTNFNSFRNSDNLSPSLHVLTVLVEQHGVSANWLLTGEGKMMK